MVSQCDESENMKCLPLFPRGLKAINR
uniref:Uncharacterized protein n=1 Tax=Tetranychus urticae TaxID=32264 RepID=T1KYM7_TETUR